MKKFDFKRIGVTVGGVAAGAIVARVADKPLVNMNPKLRGVLKIVAGAIVSELTPKQPFVSNIGHGILAIGAVDTATAFVPGLATPAPAVTGIGAENTAVNGIGATSDYVITDSNMNGVGDGDEMSGIGDDENLAGIGNEVNEAVSGPDDDQQ